MNVWLRYKIPLVSLFNQNDLDTRLAAKGNPRTKYA